MKTFYLDFNLNYEEGRMKQFIKDIEEYEECFMLNTDEGKLIPLIEEFIGKIYIDCSGGENRIASILYDFLSNRPFKYKFVVTGSFSSNAILVMLALNPNDIEIKRQCSTVIHLSNYNHPINTIAFTKESDPNISDFLDFKDYLNSLMIVYKNFLTKKELKICEIGGDVFLSSQRVAEIFQKLKKDKKFQRDCKNIFEITL